MLLLVLWHVVLLITISFQSIFLGIEKTARLHISAILKSFLENLKMAYQK